MGTYLSTPVLDKCHEEGESLAKTERPLAWGVVDMQGWRKTMEDAHIVETDVVSPNSFSDTAKVFAVFDGHGGAEVARFCQLYLVSVLTNQLEWQGVSCNVDIGKALVNCFHELDCMLNNSLRRDEITRLRLRKPDLGEKRCLNGNNFPSVSSLNRGQNYSDEDTIKISGDLSEHNIYSRYVAENKLNEKINFIDSKNELKESTKNTDSSQVHLSFNLDKCEKNSAVKINDKREGIDFGISLVGELACKGETIDDNKSLLNDYLPERSEKKSTSTRSGPSTFSIVENRLSNNNTYKSAELVPGSDVLLSPNQYEVENKNNIVNPTKILNGRQVCNLPDHPINAGCTSICAVIVGDVLTVANAGDSRAVLCRVGGMAQPLSFDHKPLHETEMKRIIDAGGFVNHFGRVNGNLNLSRSIGDLKYKQTTALPPSAQIITAEPDITQVKILPNDEFIILACDGVWDCLSNEEAVRYVYEHIDNKKLTLIGIELFDKIVSVDPRASQGIGGDNMTLMVIDLLPMKRSYRNKVSNVKSINNDNKMEDIQTKM